MTLSRAGVTLVIDGRVAGPAPKLTVSGHDFVENGKRLSLAGCDGFMDYRIWIDKREAGLDPFMRESQDLGFKVRRVFMQGDASQNQVLTLWPSREPHWMRLLGPFVAYQNMHGITPLLTFTVDNQIVKSDIPHLWESAAKEVQGLSVLFSFGNELDKNDGRNGASYTDAFDPGYGIPWSRGSKTQDLFNAPMGATATEFHPVRDYNRCLMDAVASTVYMRDHGCGMLWMDEGIPWDNGMNPKDAWQLARVYSTLWALAVFHNRQGQRGQLLGPGTRDCAVAWVDGMRL